MSIISNPVTGPVTGQPIHPNFSQQFAGTPPLNNLTSIPATTQLLEAVSRGVVPRNAMVTAVAGVSTGAQNPTPIDDLMSNGGGSQVNGGVAVANTAGNPVSNGANNQEVFVSGNWNVNAGLSTGPAPTNAETLTSCPVSGATTGANITLNAQYAG